MKINELSSGSKDLIRNLQGGSLARKPVIVVLALAFPLAMRGTMEWLDLEKMPGEYRNIKIQKHYQQHHQVFNVNLLDNLLTFAPFSYQAVLDLAAVLYVDRYNAAHSLQSFVDTYGSKNEWDFEVIGKAYCETLMNPDTRGDVKYLGEMMVCFIKDFEKGYVQNPDASNQTIMEGQLV